MVEVNNDVILDAAAPQSWNIKEDYVAPPILPAGTYFAVITQNEHTVSKRTGRPGINFQLAVVDSGTNFPGTEQPMDATRLRYSVWLPCESDKSAPAWKNGKPAYQGMIDMLKEFVDRMKLSVNVPADLADIIDHGELVNSRVRVTVSNVVQKDEAGNETGRIFHEVDKIFAA